jgi:hypothetical protein
MKSPQNSKTISPIDKIVQETRSSHGTCMCNECAEKQAIFKYRISQLSKEGESARTTTTPSKLPKTSTLAPLIAIAIIVLIIWLLSLIIRPDPNDNTSTYQGDAPADLW